MGTVHVYKLTRNAVNYDPTKKELDYYKQQFTELASTISSLSMADKQFRELFSLETRSDVLETVDSTDMGAIDMEFLKKQIDRTIENVGEIRDYLSEAQDLYMATPMGWPVKGWLTSKFGWRQHPIKKTRDFHSGLDVSARPGTPVRATADGIVSFAGRSGANGNLVAIDHGFGYRTYYAHNKKVNVNVGDIVKRGDVISFVGSTGSSTGPHLHYEVWKNGKDIDPMSYVKGGNW